MLYNDSNEWLDYTSHILREEGKTSANPTDKASKCVPTGQIHTNKGVTYCTFKERASTLGISPVSYERFLNLTDEDVAKFIYSFYNAVQGSNFPDSISLAMTEAGWMSGTDRAFTHLYDALKNLGQTANSKTEAVQKAKILPEKVLFDEYIKLRRQYLQMLLKSPKYATNTGWISRLQRFYDKFNPDVIGSKKKNSLFNLSDIIDSLFGNK